MRKNNTAIIFGGLFFSCSVMAGAGTLAPTVVPMVNGGQASIAISNTSPNLFTVPGDRIIAVNSLDGALTNNEQTASGGVVVATVNKKPFTFILETERGLNLSIQAVPREGAGRTIQLVSDLRGTGEEAGAWETSTPYESLLVTISQAVRGGKLPAGWYQVPVTKETLQAPAGLAVFVLISLLVNVRTSVQIIDNSDLVKVHRVDNVPVGLAMPLSLTTRIGHAMVASYEMIFTQPDSVTYSKTGMLFGAELVSKSTDFLSRNPEIANLFQDYVQNCVMGDIYLNHKYTLEELMVSADPYTLIFSRPSPLRGVYDSNNNFVTCKDASV